MIVHVIDFSDSVPAWACGRDVEQRGGGTPYYEVWSDRARQVPKWGRVCGNCRRVVMARIEKARKVRKGGAHGE